MSIGVNKNFGGRTVGRKFEKGSGRLSLRLSPAMHEELGNLAEALGVDVTTLLNQMISHALPEFRAKAKTALTEMLRDADWLESPWDSSVTAEERKAYDKLVRGGRKIASVKELKERLGKQKE